MDDIPSSLRQKKLWELKEICKRCNLPANGSKADLVQKIFGHVKSHGTSALEFWNSLVEREIKVRADGVSHRCSICKLENKKLMTIRGVNICLQCQLLFQSNLEDVESILVSPFFVSTGNQNNCVQFQISPELLNQIKESRGELQVQIRCIKLEPIGFLPYWPRLGSIVLDSKIIMELLARKPNEKMRKDDSLNITALLSPGGHSLRILAEPESSKYYAGLYLVRRKLDAQIRSEVVRRDSPVTFQEALKHAFTKSSGDGITTESLQISLLCPIQKTLISTPVKGIFCKHLACFDLDSWLYLQRNATSNRYKCPICKNPAVGLYKDLFISMILEKAQRTASPISAKILANGDFEIIDFDTYFDAQDRLKRKATSDDQPQKRHKEGSLNEPIDLD